MAATCNALSSAELAAEYPQSGGTYEYGYRVLDPWAGFAAGWMFPTRAVRIPSLRLAAAVSLSS